MTMILILLIVSGIVAYLGDWLGTYVGKRRLTILGLRPRATAILVAISTGMLITSITLFTAAVLSEQVRIALFSVQQLTDERERLSHEVQGLQVEQKRLEADILALKDRVRSKELTLVVCRKDEPLSAVIIRRKTPAEEVRRQMVEFCSSLSRQARSRGLLVKNEDGFLSENREQLEKMADHISVADQDLVVGAIAVENKTVGENLGQVKFVVRPNSLIFPAGDQIARLELDGSQPRDTLARSLLDFMETINRDVVQKGMIGNPLTGRFGDLSSESMLSFYDMVQQVRTINRKIAVVAIAREDTYAIGPLNVNFKLASE